MNRYWKCSDGHRNEITYQGTLRMIWRYCDQCPISDNGPYRVDIYIPEIEVERVLSLFEDIVA